MTKLNPSENLFSELLKKSCRVKDYGVKPEVEVHFKNIFGHFRLEVDIGSIDLNIIDSALEKEKLVAVTYDVEIFERERLSKKQANHASTIVGSMSVCGEPYYMLRNSYGKKSCSIDMEYFAPSQSSQSKIKLNDCYDEVEKGAYSLYPECTIIKCIENRIAAYQEWRNDCDGKYKKKYLEEVNHPFFCDPDGNYIVSGKHLQKGVFSAEFIRN